MTVLDAENGRSDLVQAWRQPVAERVDGGGARDRGRLSRYLVRVFEGSEDENKRVILDAVRAGPARVRMLDLGCYNGAFTRDVAGAARAREIVGIEWIGEHADAARANGVDVVKADLNDPWPFTTGSFDLVHANQVIEHLRGTDEFLREAARVCAPGGRVILSTNNLASWHNVASLVAGYQPLPSHVSDELHVGNPLDPRRGTRHVDIGQTHLRVFTLRALTELAEAQGMRVVGVHMNGYYPLPPKLARWAARVDPRHAAFMVVELAP